MTDNNILVCRSVRTTHIWHKIPQSRSQPPTRHRSWSISCRSLSEGDGRRRGIEASQISHPLFRKWASIMLCCATLPNSYGSDIVVLCQFCDGRIQYLPISPFRQTETDSAIFPPPLDGNAYDNPHPLQARAIWDGEGWDKAKVPILRFLCTVHLCLYGPRM